MEQLPKPKAELNRVRERADQPNLKLTANQVALWLTSALYMLVCLIGITIGAFMLVELVRFCIHLHRYLDVNLFN